LFLASATGKWGVVDIGNRSCAP